jgi:hypothetical protein
VSETPTTHILTLGQIRQWCDRAGSPNEVLKRQRVKALIG